MRQSSATDRELVIAARCGEAASLGLLFERHRPRLLASALRLLGHGADAEDAVQETFLLAVRYLGALRDPDRAGAWLHAILRRACLAHRRRTGPEVLTDLIPESASAAPTAEDTIEKLELREWIWNALEALPEPLRVTSMLRYFGSYDSYEEIAATLGIPVGTVRSRLSDAKIKLAEALIARAGLVGDDSQTRARADERFWRNAFEEIFRRGESRAFVRHFDADLSLLWSSGARARGREPLATEIDSDLAAGVSLHLERVMATDGVTIVEGRFVNPPEAPEHCPPGIALVLFGGAGRASRIHLHLAPRRPRVDPQ